MGVWGGGVIARGFFCCRGSHHGRSRSASSAAAASAASLPFLPVHHHGVAALTTGASLLRLGDDFRRRIISSSRGGGGGSGGGGEGRSRRRGGSGARHWVSRGVLGCVCVCGVCGGVPELPPLCCGRQIYFFGALSKIFGRAGEKSWRKEKPPLLHHHIKGRGSGGVASWRMKSTSTTS
jgi:hypothetical protein